MNPPAPAPAADDDIWIVYDGDCPFCAAYVRMVRLKQAAAGRVHLINARDAHPAVDEALAAGLDLDEGMAMKLGGSWVHGDEVIHRLALMSGSSNLANRLHYWVFRSPARARLLYPWLRAGRNLALRLLGHGSLAAAGRVPVRGE